MFHPFLPASRVRDLGNQRRIGDHPKSPGLFIPTRGRKPPGLQDLLQDRPWDRPVLKCTRAEPVSKKFCNHMCDSFNRF